MLFFSSAVLRVRVVKTARGCSPLERGVYMAEVNKPRLPKDDTKEINALGRGGMRLAHYAFNFECWEFRPGIGKDVGEDCVYEYIDDHIWHNRRIRAQVKGIRNPATYLVAKDTEFSYPLDKQFIEYALRSNEAFVLLLCDLLNEKVKEKRKFFDNLLNLTFIDCIKHLRGDKNINCLEGLPNIDKICNGIKGDEDYKESFKCYIDNFIGRQHFLKETKIYVRQFQRVSRLLNHSRLYQSRQPVLIATKRLQSFFIIHGNSLPLLEHVIQQFFTLLKSTNQVSE